MNTLEFLGMRALDEQKLHWGLDVEPALTTPGDFLFGGCGLAAGIVSMEEASGRPTVWATAQYLSYAPTDSHMELEVVLAVVGRRTAQARSVGHVDDKEILTVNAALGAHAGPFSGVWVESAPAVERPENCPERGPLGAPMPESIFDKIDTRQALGRTYDEMMTDKPVEGPAHSAIWARLPGHLEPEAASLAIFGDLVGGAVAQVVGRPTYGTSLDNTLRVVELSPTEWVLCDIYIDAMAGGYAQGRAHLWSDEGRLLATASQSMSVRPIAE